MMVKRLTILLVLMNNICIKANELMKNAVKRLTIIKEDTMKKLYGVTTAMTTPMHKDESVNLEELEKLINFLIERGVDCLYPLGTTGEMFKLSVEERKEVAERVITSAAGRVTVFIHVGAMTLKDTLVLAKHAYESGADGIGVVTPSFFSANEEELEFFYTTVAQAIPEYFPMYLYSIPQLSGNELPVSVVEKPADKHKNIIGIKYSYPDFLMLQEYQQVRNGNFSVLTGTDALFIPAMAMGCDGVISGVSGVYPEPFVEVLAALKNNDLERAKEIQKDALKLIHLLKAGANMSYFKKALETRGIQAGSVRAPQIDIDEKTESLLHEELKHWK